MGSFSRQILLYSVQLYRKEENQSKLQKKQQELKGITALEWRDGALNLMGKNEHYAKQTTGNSCSGGLELLLHQALTQIPKGHAVLMQNFYF